MLPTKDVLKTEEPNYKSLNKRTKHITMEGFNLILFCFCDWWWLLWLIPAILGYLLGSSMGSWKSKYETAQRDLDSCRNKSKSLQRELDECRIKSSSLQSDLDACLKSKAQAPKASTTTTPPPPPPSPATASTGFAAVPTPPPAAPAPPPPTPAAPKRSGAWAKLKEDNLQFIEGIGPKMNEVLNENGVSTWAKLANMDRDGLKAVLNKYGDKYKIIEPGDWPRQAKFAVEEDWDGLIKYQSDDGSAAKVRKLFIKLGIMDDAGNYKA